MPLTTPAELTAILRDEFPDFDAEAYAIEDVTAGTLRMRLLVDRRHLRPGGTVLGPVLMQLADLAAYFCVMAPIAPAVQAVTTSLNIHFLRRPRMADVVAHARVLRRGKRLAVIDVTMFTDGEDEPVAQATVSYAIPAR